MRTTLSILGLTLAALSAFACASTRPPQELVDARAAYARAYEGPAAQANASGLGDAKRVLDQAEEKFADDPGSEEVRHLAYVAQRRIMIAETNARTSIAAAQRVQAEQAVVRLEQREKASLQLQNDEQKARTTKP